MDLVELRAAVVDAADDEQRPALALQLDGERERTIVAASQAAHEIALNQYPEQAARWQQLLARTAGQAPQERSVELGKAAAAAVLDSRKADRWDQQAEYRFHPLGPGVYAEFHEHSGTPEGFVFGAGCAAAMTVMANTFGAEREFTMEVAEVDKAGPGSGKIALQPAMRSFASFRDAAMECALSRVYLGIHFRYDSVAGNQLGNDIGRYAIAKYLVAL